MHVSTCVHVCARAQRHAWLCPHMRTHAIPLGACRRGSPSVAEMLEETLETQHFTFTLNLGFLSFPRLEEREAYRKEAGAGGGDLLPGNGLKRAGPGAGSRAGERVQHPGGHLHGGQVGP